MVDERRSLLHKYYRHIRNCKLCKEKYGTDRKHETGLCPVCQEKSNLKNSMLWEGKAND